MNSITSILKRRAAELIVGVVLFLIWLLIDELYFQKSDRFWLTSHYILSSYMFFNALIPAIISSVKNETAFKNVNYTFITILICVFISIKGIQVRGSVLGAIASGFYQLAIIVIIVSFLLLNLAYKNILFGRIANGLIIALNIIMILFLMMS